MWHFVHRAPVVLVFLAVFAAGCKRDEKDDPATPASSVTSADYIGTYLGTTNGSTGSYLIAVSQVDASTITFSSDWGRYTSAETFNATINGDAFTIPVRSNWVQHIGTTGGNNETFEGTGVRNGNSLQLNLVVKGYYPPEMGGGVFSTWNLTIVATRQ